MDCRKRLAVHLPCEQDFVNLHLANWNRDGVVVHLALLEVRVCAKELEMSALALEATAVLDDLLQGDTGPAGGTDGAFTPGRVDELVAVTGVLVDLLDTASSGTLETDDSGLAGEYRLILKHLEGDLLGVVDEALDFEEVLAGVDFWNTAVVADEEVGVVRNLSLHKSARTLRLVLHKTCLNQPFLWVCQCMSKLSRFAY